MAINSFDTIEKAGGSVMLYYRNSLTCQRKKDLEISNNETLWSEVTLPKSKPFLLCTIYRPPNVNSDWIDAFEEELPIAQTTRLEIIVMGDLSIDLLNCSNRKWLNLIYRPPNVNSDWIDAFEEELSIAQTTGLEIIVIGELSIDLLNCSNRKWLNLIQLFDLKQLISDPTRITNKTSTLTDHLHCSNPENISDCFVLHYSVSDHFPICFSRKLTVKSRRLPIPRLRIIV